MAKNNLIQVGGELVSTDYDGIVADAAAIKDYTPGREKSQKAVNDDVEAGLADRYTKEETYNREEIAGLVDPTDYVSVVATSGTTAVTDVLPVTGASDTIYRVGNWDGTQYDPTVYSLYAWNGTAYVCLAVRSFVGEVYDISANHPDGQGNPTVYADLGAALGVDGANVPEDIRSGGMSVKFIQGDNVQSSDNKYVQYRLTADEWSTDTEDWAIAEEGVLVENPELIYVKTDANDKILWAIRTDGDIFYGAGVPSQVVNYINEKIAELSLDEYEDIVAFLNDLEKGDKTLQTLLNEKVDKEDGKSLIDAEYANGVHYIENPEFAEVYLDSENKIIWAVKTDGSIYYGAGVPQQVIDYVTEKISELSLDEYDDIVTFLGNLIEGDTLDILLNTKVDKVTGKSLIDTEYANGINYVESPEFTTACIDSENKILFGVKADGDFYFGYGVPTQIVDYVNSKKSEILAEVATALDTKVDKVTGKGLIQNDVANSLSAIEDPEGRNEITTDSEGRIVSYRDSDGVKHEEAGIETNNATVNHLNLTETGMTEFQQALKDAGFNPGGTGDWSDYLSNDGDSPLCIPQPKGAAMLNILSNVNLSALTKEITPGAIEGITYNVHAEIEFWDMDGNYFKKPVLMSGQGNSSMQFPKKNIAIDIFDSEVDGDAFAVKFGDWVSQDSWHLKAYYTDAFRCIGLATYKWFDEIVRTRGIKSDYVYKKALIDFTKIGYVANGYNDLSDLSLQYESGAKCFPDGFPVIVYQNGNFWGLFCWQIKKHRDNYHMKKSNKKHIHLDGTLNATTFFNGNVNWEEFEVRNPKDLIDMDGKKYNGDIPKELIDSTSQYYDSTNTKHVNTAAVKQYVINFSHVMATLNTAEATYNASSKTAEDLATLKAVFETYFDVENLIDYLIVSDVSRNYDGFSKNWQWITYDGVKWYCCLYDCDGCFGGNFTGTSTMLPLSGGHISTSLMNHFIVTYYNTELNTRYAELRNSKVINADAVIRIIDDLMLKFGTQNISKEFEIWTNCPCNRDTVVNENWEFDLDENGNPQLGTANYNNSTTYNAGDSCFYAQYPGNGEATYKYKAKATVTGVKPVDSFGYRDSIYRLYNWIKKSIENMDIVYSYNN